MPAFNPDLKALMDKHNVHADIQTFLQNDNVTSIGLFADYIDDVTEAKVAIVDLVVSCKDKRTPLAAVKMAWREATKRPRELWTG